jgi:hypothetical protein
MAHENEWNRYTISARTHSEAAETAAQLDWWLHCWTWKEADTEHVVITEHAPPGGHPSWQSYTEQAEKLRQAAQRARKTPARRATDGATPAEADDNPSRERQ